MRQQKSSGAGENHQGKNGHCPRKVPLLLPDKEKEEVKVFTGKKPPRDARAKRPWLWPGKLQFGSVSVVQGEKGAGKSTFLRLLAAHVTAGVPLPGVRQGKRCQGGVLWFAGEEDLWKRVEPGLKAAGANMKRCILEDDHGEESEILRLPVDCPSLAETVRRNKIVLVVIDPVIAFVDGMAEIEGGSVPARRFMRPIREMAASTGACVVLTRNLVKNTTHGALAAGRGSGELGNAARTVLHLHSMPQTAGLYALAVAAGNDAVAQQSLTYTLRDKDGQGVWVVEGNTDLNADELVSGEDGDLDRSALERAKRIIREMIPTGKLDARIVKRKAEEAMIALRTLQLAAKRLGVRYEQTGTRGDMVSWWMPPKGGWK